MLRASRALALGLLLLPPAGVMAQVGPGSRPDSVARLPEVTVTATRTARLVFGTPHPVTVVDSLRIRQLLGNNAADLLRSAPGVDIVGIGPSHQRVAIRGQRGQRILLLEDGIRLNNARRQQDFGEIPALVGSQDLLSVELVRGPASVLYGSDAIGGVVNMVTNRAPHGRTGWAVQGTLGYRFIGAGDQQQLQGVLVGHAGRFGFSAGAQYRDADSYRAPTGQFGDVSLDAPVRVHDAGVQDAHYHLEAAYGSAGIERFTLRYTRYEARDAGFGFVEPARLGDNSGTRIRLHYPDQQVDRVTAGYSRSALRSAMADKVDVTVYTAGNHRDFSRSVVVPLSPTARLSSDSRTLTDSRTNGLRLEATKALAAHLLTYGVDYFHEQSDNTDSSRTVITGFGPPNTTISTTPSVPNATYRSLGLFAQGDLALADRVNLVVGVRYQDVAADTRETPGLTVDPIASGDDALVGSANLGIRASDHLNLIVTTGRAFRSPNLIERFFNGLSSDGSGFQRPNPDLVPETSFNVDLGARYRRGALYAEAFLFRNQIADGIRAAPTGEQQQGRPVFRNVNLERLREIGAELFAEVAVGSGVVLGATYTTLHSTNVADEGSPVGDGYSSRVIGHLAWRDPAGRFHAGYELRHNGVRQDVVLGTSPIGDHLPAFTVHSLRAGGRLFRVGGTSHRLDVRVGNLFNRLYAEFPNAGFFRPEPGRHVALHWTLDF